MRASVHALDESGIPHDIPARARVELQLTRTTMDLVPGGYLFTHIVFWTVVAMVALGTNAAAIILSIGLGILAMESFKS